MELVPSGEDAIVAMKTSTFDVVILDYKMPGLTGLNVLQWMHEQKLSTPVIMLTGAGSEIVAVEAMKLGAYDYVSKPLVDLDHLPIIINGVHERHLFKLEKEHRQRVEQMHFEIVDEFRQTVADIGALLVDGLSTMDKNFEKTEKEILPLADPAVRVKVTDAFAALRQDHSVVAFASHTILSSTDKLHEKIAATIKSPGPGATFHTVPAAQATPSVSPVPVAIPKS
jgi:CheY-like chemotaxis protein